MRSPHFRFVRSRREVLCPLRQRRFATGFGLRRLRWWLGTGVRSSHLRKAARLPLARRSAPEQTQPESKSSVNLPLAIAPGGGDASAGANASGTSVGTPIRQRTSASALPTHTAPSYRDR